MEIFTHNDKDIDNSGTSLQGKIQATREELEVVFGLPMDFSFDEGDKVSTQWSIEFADGNRKAQVVTIYDWKRKAPPEMKEVISWHIGGLDQEANSEVHKAFRKAHHLAAAYA